MEIVLTKLRWHEMQFDKQRFKCIRDAYNMSDHVNIIFGWSNLALIMQSLLSSIMFLNFLYEQISNKFSSFQTGLLNSIFITVN